MPSSTQRRITLQTLIAVFAMSYLPAALSAALSAEHGGVIDKRSAHGPEETAKRLVTVLESKGMRIFNRVAHAKAAAGVGVALRPTELIIFGNPKVGSALMACAQQSAIDLPLKALIWRDSEGVTWISYNDPAYLKARHNIQGCDAVIGKMSKALAAITDAAAIDSSTTR